MPKPTLEQVNEVLIEVWPSLQYQLYYDEKGGLRLKNNRSRTMRAVLRGDHTWLKDKDYQMGMGGTINNAIAQIILWYRGLPHRPISNFQYLMKQGLGNDKMIELMQKYDFNENTNCVLCGNPTRFGTDWWSLGKKIGPACWAGRCQNKKED